MADDHTPLEETKLSGPLGDETAEPGQDVEPEQEPEPMPDEAIEPESEQDSAAQAPGELEVSDDPGSAADVWAEPAVEQDAEAVYWAEGPVDVIEPPATDLEAASGQPSTGEAPADDASQEAEPGVLGAPAEVDMGPERRSRWWVWLLAGLAVAMVAGGATYGWWWMTARDIVVPDLVGKQAADATQTLNDVALVLGKVSEVPTDVAPVGTVISQKPEAGSRLKPDARVSFVLAAAPEQAKVPNVVGLSTDDAAAALAKARLRPREVASHSATVAAGFVIGQVPGNGTELMPGNPVALAVSKGPAPGNTTAPGVTGLAQGDAVALIGARGLTARVYQSLDPSLGAGIVVTQTPLPNTSLAPGASVQILVSKGFGTGTVTVPDVVNDPRKAAVDAVRAAGLRAVTVFQFHPTVARGTVISQMPFGGRRVQSGDGVGLLISRGPLTTALVPSIVGSASVEATAAVQEAGFKPVVVEVEMPGRTAGTVVGQFPAPATAYELRYPVICLVAKEIAP